MILSHHPAVGTVHTHTKQCHGLICTPRLLLFPRELGRFTLSAKYQRRKCLIVHCVELVLKHGVEALLPHALLAFDAIEECSFHQIFISVMNESPWIIRPWVDSHRRTRAHDEIVVLRLACRGRMRDRFEIAGKLYVVPYTQKKIVHTLSMYRIHL